MTHDLAFRAQRGAEWLDDEYPGWANDIDLDIFTSEDCQVCILGQLGEETLNAVLVARGNNAFSPELGFDLPIAPLDSVNKQKKSWAILDEAWRHEIEKRRKA